MSNHTPGPWYIDGREIVTGEPPYKRGCKNWRYIASCVGGYHNKDEMDANARLIAAAPDMLAALRKIGSEPCPDHVYHWLVDSGVLAARDAAISKAEGRS